MPADHCCALITPAGRGAIAVVSVFGPTILTRLAELFRSASGKRLAAAAHQSIFYGHWVPSGEDVVLVRINFQKWEIHCHGGHAAPVAILNSLVACGFEALSPNAATELMHGTGWKSEVVQKMSQAMTSRTATILLRQFNLVDETLLRWKNELTNDPNRALKQMTEMLDTASFGQHLVTPWSVVLCGAPNVGKSSLVNAMVGYDRVIVHETAGTTRDVVSQMTAVDGWPIELKDTAGLRTAENSIEESGIALSEAEIRRADLVVVVLDASQEIASSAVSLIHRTNAALVVMNKMDLVSDSTGTFSRLKSSEIDVEVILTSASEKTGIQAMIQAMARQLVPTIPSDHLLLPLTSIQLSRLQHCLGLLHGGQFVEANAEIDRWRG